MLLDENKESNDCPVQAVGLYLGMLVSDKMPEMISQKNLNLNDNKRLRANQATVCF